jgi:ammonia channel protein AmtB
MQDQNFKNHAKLVPGYHYVTLSAILIFLIASVNYSIQSSAENKYLGAMLCLLSVILVMMAWYVRGFALKAQDRAIRAEENFRYYLATGKAFPKELTMGQIIALRFAADDEFIALAAKAVAENLSNKDIKSQIKNWKADHYRA